MNQLEQINKLIIQSKNAPEQRSKEWHRKRRTLFTASNCSLLINTVSNFFGETKNSLIRNKIDSIRKIKYGLELTEKPFISTMSTRHGTIFEHPAEVFYTFLNPDIKFFEAGLIENEKFPHLGASPDGFLINKTNNECSLIEIKCPYGDRDITKILPYYYDQMQLQMMITEIDKCEYFVVNFEQHSFEPELLIDDVFFFGGVKLRPLAGDFNDEFIYDGFVGKEYENFEDLMSDVEESEDFLIPTYFTVKEYYHETIHVDKEWQEIFMKKFSVIKKRIENV